MGSYWALFTAIADGVIDFDAGNEAKSYSPLVVSWVIAFATLVSLLALGLLGFSVWPSAMDLIYGLPIGLLLAYANVVYFKALASGPMGVISAVSGIAVMVPVLYDSLIGKAPTLLSGLGMLAILFGVYLIAQDAQGSKQPGAFKTRVLIMAVVAAVTYGASDVLFKRGTDTDGISLLLVIQVVECLSFSAILAMRRIKAHVRRRDLLVLAPLGLANMLGWLAYTRAAQHGQIDIVSALIYCSPVFTLLLAHLCIGEILSRRELLAFCTILVGAWLVV